LLAAGVALALVSACSGGIEGDAALTPASTVGSATEAQDFMPPSLPPETALSTSSASNPASDSTAPVGDGLEQNAPDPIRVRIPAIEVDSSTIPLGLRDDGSIEVPQDFAQTGWWKDGPEPGEAGPSVVLGHIDSTDGPAVFYRLRDLEAGDEIHIDREDDTTVTYVVERAEQHAKDAFPTDDVYGSTSDAVLRLVTCGGEFDSDARSYIDNYIVFASIAA